MGSFSIWHILILGAAALLLFGGRGKISDFMGDFGKGIKSFKKGLIEEDSDEPISRDSSSVRRNSVGPAAASAPLAASVPAQVGEG